MADTQEVLGQARALGAALAAHPTVQAHLEAQRALRSDTAAQQLLRDYQQQFARLRQLETEQKPIEVEDKHKLRDLELKMASHETLKKFMRTQADYVALRTQADRAVDAALVGGGASQPPA